MPQFNLIYCFDYFLGCIITWFFLYVIVSFTFLPYVTVFYYTSLYIFLILRYLVGLILFKQKLILITFNYTPIFKKRNENDVKS